MAALIRPPPKQSLSPNAPHLLLKPADFKNTQSFLDVQGGRAVIHFETASAESIQQYTADWPELVFDIFPVVPTEKGWEAYLDKSTP